MASVGALGPTGYRLVPLEPAGTSEPPGATALDGPPAIPAASDCAADAPPLDLAGAERTAPAGGLSPLEGRLEAIEGKLEAAERAADGALQSRQRQRAAAAAPEPGPTPELAVPSGGSGSQFAEAFNEAFSEYCLPGGGVEPAPTEDSPRTLDPTPGRPPPDVPLVGGNPAAVRGSVVLVNGGGLRALVPELPPEQGPLITSRRDGPEQAAEPLARWLAAQGPSRPQPAPLPQVKVVAKYETEPRELCRFVISRSVTPAPALRAPAAPQPRGCPPTPDLGAGAPRAPAAAPQPRGCPPTPDPGAGALVPLAAAPQPRGCPPTPDPGAGALVPLAGGPLQRRAAGEPPAAPQPPVHAAAAAATSSRPAPGPPAAPAGLAQDSPLFWPQRFDFYRDPGGAWAPSAAGQPPSPERSPGAWPGSAPVQPGLLPPHWCGAAPLTPPSARGGAPPQVRDFEPPPPPPPPPAAEQRPHAERDALLVSARKLEERVQELLSGQASLRHELEQVRMEVRDSSRHFEQPLGPVVGGHDPPELGAAPVPYHLDKWGGPPVPPDTVFYPHAEQQHSPHAEQQQQRQQRSSIPPRSEPFHVNLQGAHSESQVPYQPDQWGGPPVQPDTVFQPSYEQQHSPHAEQQQRHQQRSSIPPRREFSQNRLLSRAPQAEHLLHDHRPAAPPVQTQAIYQESTRIAEEPALGPAPVETQAFYHEGAQHAEAPVDTQVFYPQGSQHGEPPPNPPPVDTQVLGSHQGAPQGEPASGPPPADAWAAHPPGVLRSDSVQSHVWYPQSADEWSAATAGRRPPPPCAGAPPGPRGPAPALAPPQEAPPQGAPASRALSPGSRGAVPAGPPAPPANLGFGRSQEFIDRWVSPIAGSFMAGTARSQRKSGCA